MEGLNCSARYIGKTGRALAIRGKKHLPSKRHGVLTGPMGTPRISAHDGNDHKVKCMISSIGYLSTKSFRSILDSYKESSLCPAVVSAFLLIAPHSELWNDQRAIPGCFARPYWSSSTGRTSGLSTTRAPEATGRPGQEYMYFSDYCSDSINSNALHDGPERPLRACSL